MKAWLVRFVSLYVFDVVVLLLIGMLLGSVRVGWAAFWAALVLTAATIWVKPLVRRMFRAMTAPSAAKRSRLGEKAVQGLLVFAVEVIVWIAVVLFSGVAVRGWFWGWVLPPIALLIAFAIYDLVDDRIEARTGALFDRVSGGRSRTDAAAAPAPPARDRPASGAAPTDRYDGLTPEQRRMLDDLG